MVNQWFYISPMFLFTNIRCNGCRICSDDRNNKSLAEFVFEKCFSMSEIVFLFYVSFMYIFIISLASIRIWRRATNKFHLYTSTSIHLQVSEYQAEPQILLLKVIICQQTGMQPLIIWVVRSIQCLKIIKDNGFLHAFYTTLSEIFT